MKNTLLLITALLAAVPAFSAEPKPLTFASVDQRTVTVDAIALAKAPPEKVEWLLEIKTTRASVKDSRAVVDASLQRLLAALKSAGVKDDALAISDVDQGRDIEWSERKRIFKGLYSSLTLRLTITDFSLVGRINSEILSDDLIDVKWMARRNDHEGELRQRALADAAVVARKKAEVLASTLGAKVGDVIRVEETSFAENDYSSFNVQAVSRSEPANTQLMEISVRAAIKVTFELVK